MWKGGEPTWLSDATEGFDVAGQPYFINGFVAGYVRNYPLHAAPSSSQPNMILWVMRFSDGSDLHIAGHPYTASTPTIDETAGSVPGSPQVYPATVDVPTAGCWELEVSTEVLSGKVDIVYS